MRVCGARKRRRGGTLSTAVMTAWAVIRAMERHEPFASYVSKGSLERDPECFDLGVAVALPGDKLETAVIQKANTLEWDAFPDRFQSGATRGS